MQCEYADYRSLKQSVSTYTIPPLQNCSQVALVEFPQCNSLSQLLKDNVLWTLLSAAMHERRATVKATADITVTSDAAAQRGLVGESGPGSVQSWRMERKLSVVPRVFKKLCAMMERATRP